MTTRYETGATARREGKARIGGHLQPCLLAYCRRPECRGWQEEDGRIRQRAAKLDAQDCGQCDGLGAYWDDQTGQPDEPNGGRMVTCHVCKGDKVVDTSPCIGCGAPTYDHDDGCPVEDCPDHGLTDIKTNEHRDAWCGRCGERLIIPGHAGWPVPAKEVRT